MRNDSKVTLRRVTYRLHAGGWTNSNFFAEKKIKSWRLDVLECHLTPLCPLDFMQKMYFGIHIFSQLNYVKAGRPTLDINVNLVPLFIEHLLC